MTVLCPVGYKYDYSEMDSSDDPIVNGWISAAQNGVNYEISFNGSYTHVKWLTNYGYYELPWVYDFNEINLDDDYSLEFVIKDVTSTTIQKFVDFGLNDKYGNLEYGIRASFQESSIYTRGTFQAVQNGVALGGIYYLDIYTGSKSFKLTYKKNGTTLSFYINDTLFVWGEYNSTHANIESYVPTLFVTGHSGEEVEISSVTVVSTTQGTDCQGNIIANFTSDITSLTRGGIVVFTDASASVNGVTNWLWDFGDGNQSTEQNPTHIYSNFGKYTVTLTVTGTDGTDSETKTDYVFVVPSGLDTSRSTVSYTLGVDKSLISKRTK